VCSPTKERKVTEAKEKPAEEPQVKKREKKPVAYHVLKIATPGGDDGVESWMVLTDEPIPVSARREDARRKEAISVAVSREKLEVQGGVYWAIRVEDYQPVPVKARQTTVYDFV
jgi:hypothetical protein